MESVTDKQCTLREKSIKTLEKGQNKPWIKKDTFNSKN